MLPIIGYEMIRQRNEERRERSMRRFWWRYTSVDAPVDTTPSADVVEVVFGTHCDLEEPVGA